MITFTLAVMFYCLLVCTLLPYAWAPGNTWAELWLYTHLNRRIA